MARTNMTVFSATTFVAAHCVNGSKTTGAECGHMIAAKGWVTSCVS